MASVFRMLSQRISDHMISSHISGQRTLDPFPPQYVTKEA